MWGLIALDVSHFIEAWIFPVIAANIYVHWYMVETLKRHRQ